MRRLIWQYKAIYIMLLPATLFYLIFCYAPMYGVTIAFKDYWVTKGILGSPWVGFTFFKQIFSDMKFWQVFRNTIEISLFRLVFGFPAPIILSLLLNELRLNKFKRVVQTIIYLPHFISWVTIAGIMFTLLSNDGLINSIIAQLGGDKVNFLTNQVFFRPLLIVSAIWKETGWSTIIYLAALSGIPPEQYEAALIDGAGRWKQLIHVTIPGIIPVIIMLLILNVGSITNSSFDQVFNLYNPMVWEVGDVIDTYVYRVGIVGGNYSIGTAIGLFLSCINFVLLYSVNKISQKTTGTGIY